MLCDTAFHILTCTMFCIFALRFVVSIFVLVGNCFPSQNSHTCTSSTTSKSV